MFSVGEDDSAYSTGTYSPYDSPQSSTAHPSTAHTNDSRFFPETNYFPPPPNAPVEQHTPYPPYNPADYPPAPQSAYEPPHPSHFVHQPPAPEDLNFGNPYAPPPAPQQQQQPHHDPYHNNHARRSHPDDNVSAPAPDRFQKPAEYSTPASPIARGASRSMTAAPGVGMRTFTDERTDCVNADTHDGDVESERESEGASTSGSEAPTSVTTRSEKTVQFDLKPMEKIVPRDSSSPEPEPRNQSSARDRLRESETENSTSNRNRGKRRRNGRNGDAHNRNDSVDNDDEAHTPNGNTHHRHKHRHSHGHNNDHNSAVSTESSGRPRKRHHHHHHHHDRDASSASHDDDDDARSDTTIELSPRFEERGRRRAEDPLADKLESVLLGLLR